MQVTFRMCSQLAKASENMKYSGSKLQEIIAKHVSRMV